MPVLKNPKHELFAQELAKGKNAAEAYRLAGYTENRFNASRLKTTENVQQRIAEIQAGMLHDDLEKRALNREWVLDKLLKNIERGEAKGDINGVNRALELIGKELHMFVDRKQVGQPGEFAELENMSADQLRAYIMQALGEDTNKNETLN
jgi:phage terminase small subunit